MGKWSFRNILIGVFIGLLLGGGIVLAAKWSDYDLATSGTIVDADDLLFRDISATPPATGIQKRISWASLKTDLISAGFTSGAVAIVKVITEPDNLAETDFQPIWINETGLTFTITEIHAKAGTVDFDFTLKESSGTDFTSLTTIEAVTVSTVGTGIYTYELLTGIDHAVIEDGHVIGFDNSADVANYVTVVLVGTFS